MKSIFKQETISDLTARINQLNAKTTPQWGKMSVDQMLAHCNVAFEMTFDDIHPKPNAFVTFMLKLFVKNKVVGPTPYPKNGRTAPQFIITDKKDFEEEKKRLFDYLQKTQQLGESHFAGKTSHSFGALSSNEWSVMFYKHLDHHLTQFGV